MANMNPNKPVLLGIEWAPLKSAMRPLDIQTEYGYGFTVTGASGGNVLDRVPLNYYPPESAIFGQTMFYAVYPRGREDDVGQIQVTRVTVATAGVTATGATATGPGTGQNLQQQGDDQGYLFTATGQRVRVAMASMPGGLSGKRILGVDLVYQASGTPGFAFEPTLENFTVVYPYGSLMSGPPSLSQVSTLGVVRLGEVNPFWNNPAAVYPDTNAFRYPFRYPELLNLVSGSGTPLFVGVRCTSMPVSGSAKLGYLALDIYYCEESRVGYGGVALGDPNVTGTLFVNPDGDLQGQIPIRDTSFVADPTLAPGEYTLMGGLADAGDKYNAGDKVAFSSVYQYRSLLSHPTFQTTKFQRPVGNRPATAPLTTSSQYMHAASMASGAGVALGNGETPFPYYVLDAAPVYITPAGVSIEAQQQIHNEASVNDVRYEQVRFYARRFNPTAPGDLQVVVQSTGTVSITPTAFNALPELTVGENGAGTGWREVVLPIVADFTSDASFRTVSFRMRSVVASTPADQWQIMVARALIPNIAGDSTDVSASKSIYDGLQNATLTWKSPLVSGGATSDSVSTAIVVFSSDAPAPTGLAIVTGTQALTNIAIECGTPSRCVPTGISYNAISWGANGVVCDTFSRTSASGLGTADTGQTYSTTGGVATDYTIDGSLGHIAASLTRKRVMSSNGPGNDFDFTMQFGMLGIVTGGPVHTNVYGRMPDINNGYFANLQWGPTGNLTLGIYKLVAGVQTLLDTATVIDTYPTNGTLTQMNIRFRGTGTGLYAKAWKVGTTEPTGWSHMISDASIVNGDKIGWEAYLDATNTNVPPFDVQFDAVTASPATLYGATYELQRMDTMDTTWATIALLPVCTISMRDYEARVGVQSSYRLRFINIGGFNGPWSSTVNATLPAPGVTGAGTANSVLIFTSNQTPSRNLAHTMQFGSSVDEEFDFREADSVVFREQYNRDFVSAFHGTERGGDRFARTLLIRNAAVASGSEALPDFNSLRDLAWADLPYVCVRDELGDRWFAIVQVPSGNVRRNRRLYLAQVIITETTSTPAPLTGAQS